MNLHENKGEFEQLIVLAAKHIGIPDDAVRRDYYIVKMTQNLQNSEYADMCVFKGGTSLSKCYPGSINRFSEDIDLTFIPADDINNKKYSKVLKRVESTIASGFQMEKIESERNDRNKSAYVWPENENRDTCRVKLEIGSSVRPDPFSKREMKTYIQEYLEREGMNDVIAEFELEAVLINTLDITRTFLDKVMSVKRHAICGTLMRKVRHIYDVTILFERSDIQNFLKDFESLKQLLILTKETDRFYLQKRNILEGYNPVGAYCFEDWKQYFTDDDIKRRYETLHEDLLYTSEKQNFDDAVHTFEKISEIFSVIGE
ncbi:MAG: nucleotidyl transferase AbiEii/AbiGii toxin family protein [Lachnospiraceae bacterium]|jgi:predicted nucleotidyltransferase component of viral defense system